MPTKHQAMMHKIYNGAPVAMIVLLLYLSAYLPHNCTVKMLHTWLMMVSPIICDRSRCIVFNRNTVKNGVARFNANTHAELNTNSRRKFAFCNGRLNRLMMLSFTRYDCGSGVRDKKSAPINP